MRERSNRDFEGGQQRWDNVRLVASIVIGAVLVAPRSSWVLDAITVDAESATVGTIGFVVLVVPHAARFLVGPRHGRLLPAAALLEAVFLIAADVVSRAPLQGQVLPTGVVTALVEAQVFAIILVRGRWSMMFRFRSAKASRAF